MKEKVLWVCMDVVGTYLTSFNQDEKFLDKKINYLLLLDQIRALKKYEKVIFSFSTTEHIEFMDTTISEINYLLDYVNDNYDCHFDLGPQMCGNGILMNEIFIPNDEASKAVKIYYCKDKLDENYDVEEVLYIDDSPSINVVIAAKLEESRRKNGESNLRWSVIEQNAHPEFMLEFISDCPFLTIYDNNFDQNHMCSIDFVMNGLNKYYESVPLNIETPVNYVKVNENA